MRLAAAALVLAVGAACVLALSAITEWPNATIDAQVETTAPVDAVWEALVGFDDYEEWNPLVTAASGAAREGTDVELRIEPPGADATDLTAEIVILRPARKMRLQSRLIAPGVRDQELEFVIDVGPPGALIVHGNVRYEGVLVPLSGTEGVEEGLVDMLDALAGRAERAIQT